MLATSVHRQSRVSLAIAPLLLGIFCTSSGLAQTAPTVSFLETISTLDPVFTGPVQPGQSHWSVAKFINNGSQVAWTDFHITLQVLKNGAWVDSPESDGISFDQPTPYAQWLNNVKVDINGVFVGGWHVDRTNAPFDQLDFYFDTFAVQPGQQLSLHFDMSDTIGDNIWRLKQVPTIPEPETYTMWLVGAAILGWVVQRRRPS